MKQILFVAFLTHCVLSAPHKLSNVNSEDDLLFEVLDFSKPSQVLFPPTKDLEFKDNLKKESVTENTNTLFTSKNSLFLKVSDSPEQPSPKLRDHLEELKLTSLYETPIFRDANEESVIYVSPEQPSPKLRDHLERLKLTSLYETPILRDANEESVINEARKLKSELIKPEVPITKKFPELPELPKITGLYETPIFGDAAEIKSVRQPQKTTNSKTKLKLTSLYETPKFTETIDATIKNQPREPPTTKHDLTNPDITSSSEQDLQKSFPIEEIKLTGLYETPIFKDTIQDNTSPSEDDLIPSGTINFGKKDAEVSELPKLNTISNQPKTKSAMMGMPYSFDWTVNDANTGNMFSHNSSSDGMVTQGEYSVLLPDGRNQIVRYHDDGNGFNVDITYEDAHPTFKSLDNNQ